MFSGPAVTIHSTFHALNLICYSLEKKIVVLFQLKRFFPMGCSSERGILSLAAAFPRFP
jgi:hypothetical protein